jgi:uncharacterized membrane protein
MGRKKKKNERVVREAARSARPDSSQHEGFRQALWVARICFTAASGIAAWLLYYALTEKPMAGCGPGSPCDKVMGSSWAYVFEIPVSAPALLAYLALLVCSIVVTSKNATAWSVGVALSIAVIGAASWFTYLQVGVIHSVCKFCTSAHLLSVVGAVLFLVKAPRPAVSGARRLSLAALGAMLVGGLVAGQELAPHRTNVLSIYKGTIEFNLREVPLIGSPDADRFIVSLFDYTCHDCQVMHGRLVKAREHFTNSFSIITMPLPLDQRCFPRITRQQAAHREACDYAKLGLALRRVSLESFQKYEEWYFGHAETPALETCREKAREIVGKEALEKALSDPWVDGMIRKSISIYEENGKATKSYRLPQIIVGETVNTGPLRDLNELVTLLETRLPGAMRRNP